MSVELRIAGDYVHSDWGVIEEPAPELSAIGPQHLMLVTHRFVSGLAKETQPHPLASGGFAAVSFRDESTPDEDVPSRLFMHYYDNDGKRWTWELFDAHWADGVPTDLYIGRWPD